MLRHFKCCFLLCVAAGQTRDLLSTQLSSWQDQCNDATNMPDSVLSMIDELRKPVAIAPMPSPTPSRHSVV